MSDEEVVDESVESSPAVESADTESPEVASAPESAAPQQADVWSHFRQMQEFQGHDDTAIASRLYEAMQREEAAARALQQYQSIIPVAQEFLNNREAFEQWKSSRNAPQQAAPAQQAPAQRAEDKPWWNPPKINDSDRRYLTRDENGRETISESAPLDVQARLRDYQAYRAEFAEKLLSDPEKTLGPMVERVAVQRAQAIVEQKVQRMNDEQYVSSLEKENKDWLYDQNGNVSAEGLAVQKYIQDAKAMGIDGAQARWNYATRMVERDLLLSNLQRMQQPPQPPQFPQMPPQPQPAMQPTQAEKNMEFLRQQAMRQSSQRPVATTNARSPQKQMTFEERLMAVAQEQGLV